MSNFKTVRIIGYSVAITLLTSCGRSDSFTELKSPAGDGSAQPHLSLDHQNDPVLSWLEPSSPQGESGHTLFFSKLVGDTWSKPTQVAAGDNWFINWADFPSVSPVTDSLWAAHYLQKSSEGTYSYDVILKLSSDGGQSWSAPFSPHDDGTPTEHGFVSLFNWQDSVGAVWLDGRNMQSGHSDHDDHGSDPDAGMTVRSALVNEQLELSQQHVIDNLACECCQTDAAVTSDGPIMIYRNRTTDEIRDIYVSRFEDNAWTQGQAISNDGWKIEGCPVNGPAISAKGEHVSIAWFTAANDQPRVKWVQSFDSGKTFSDPIEIDAENPLGRVDVVLLDDQTSVVSWVRRNQDGEGEIMVRKTDSSGKLGPAVVFTEISISRPSGFPQMVLNGDQLLLAWTHAEGNESRVRSAQITPASLN